MLQRIGFVVALADVCPSNLSKKNEWVWPFSGFLYYCGDGAFDHCFSCRLLQLAQMNSRGGHVLDIQRKVGRRVC